MVEHVCIMRRPKSLEKALMLENMERTMTSSKMDSLSYSGDGYTFARSEGPAYRQFVMEKIYPFCL